MSEAIASDPYDADEHFTELLAACHDDCCSFNAAILGRQPFWAKQREIGQSVVDYRITVVYSGNSTGKDYFLGSCVPWWLGTRYESLVVVTGPSQNVLGSVTWKEIRRATRYEPSHPLDSIYMGLILSKGVKASPLTCTVRDDWKALGYSTTSVERASGQHNSRLLVIVNEASGVLDEVWDAIDSLGYDRLLAVGNPIRPDGRFVTLIRQADKDRDDNVPRHRAVNAIRISSRESPDAHLEKSLRGLADKTWIEATERHYGKDSLYVKVHVDAEIPTVTADRLIDPEWLDFACRCERPPIRPFDPVNKTRRISCDLGEGVGRDSTAILVRDSLGILEWRAGAALGLPEAARAIAELRNRYHVPDDRISYDGLGIGRDFGKLLRVNGIAGAKAYFGSGKPREPRRFYNLRTEAAWAARTRLNPDWVRDPAFPLTSKQAPFCIPSDENWPLLREELEKLWYELVLNLTKLVTKEDFCEELGRSPDRSDALIQSFAFGG